MLKKTSKMTLGMTIKRDARPYKHSSKLLAYLYCYQVMFEFLSIIRV